MKINRTKVVIKPDLKRVLLRPFVIPDDRIQKVYNRILTLSKKEVKKELKSVLKDFEKRHQNVHGFFTERYKQLKNNFENDELFSDFRKLLIGAYFTNEYSVESAALFNPSMVWHPDQSDLREGYRRFIISLRAAGEGHISSIVFTSGVIDEKNNIALDRRSKFITNPQIINNIYSGNNLYEVEYSENAALSERIIFPHAPSEVNGIEDARFVEFHNEDGERIYYATYTAYDGKQIHPQLIETKDFLHFKISSLTGSEVQNKGMALFPRKINGLYAMISRQDNENIYLMYSEDIHTWNKKELIIEPEYPWEYIQLGNCGSPIETEDGWLLLSHGVGALRKYTIGAFLLDKSDPSRLIGRLREPIISPNKKEREGYVPNVVYSCGGLINNSEFIIPYAMSDYASGFAKINLEELLNTLKSNLKHHRRLSEN